MNLGLRPGFILVIVRHQASVKLRNDLRRETRNYLKRLARFEKAAANKLLVAGVFGSRAREYTAEQERCLPADPCGTRT